MDTTDAWGSAAGSYLVSKWHANEAALQHAVDVAKPGGGTLLDIATGAGHVAFAFSPHVDRVVAIDTSGGMLELAKSEAQRRRITNVEFKLADALKLPFEDASFDGAVCRVSAHHFVEPGRFLSEAYRILRPGGYLLLVDTVGSEDADADQRLHNLESVRDPSHVRNYPVKQWRKMAKRAGFDITYEETNSKPLNALEWMDRKNVPAELRPNILEMITKSDGWFREYLRPHGAGDSLTFHLQEMTMLLVRP